MKTLRDHRLSDVGPNPTKRRIGVWARRASSVLALGLAFGVAWLAWSWVAPERDVLEPKTRPRTELRVVPGPAPLLTRAAQAAPEPLWPKVRGEAGEQPGSSPEQMREALKARRTAARSLAEAGWRLVEAGEYQRATQVFTQATELAPDEPSFLVGLGLSHHRLSRDDLAVAELERAVRLEPYVGLAHKLLGEIYERVEEHDVAIHHYETAQRQDPNDVQIQDGLLAARREQRAEAGLDRLFSPHFVVKFPRQAGRQAAGDAADRLERAYRTLGQQLAYFPPEAFMVILHPARRFREATVAPHWARGLFDGRIHVSGDLLTADASTAEAALRHEYTHAVVHRLSGGRAPTWLHEGLALVFEGGDQSWGRAVLVRHAEDLTPLGSLHGSFLGLPPAVARVAYAESYGATLTLIDRYGLGKVRRLLEALPGSPDFPSAFEAVTKERYSDFDASWLAAQAGTRF